MTQIIPIVEGHGDVEAVPILIRRIADLLGKREIEVEPPIRCPKDRMLDKAELGRAIEYAVLRFASDEGRILILRDSDGNCPGELAGQVAATAKSVRPDVRLTVVVAHAEFESWFLASLPSLAGKRGIRKDVQAVADPETISGAKEKLEELMEAQNYYSETLDQPALASQFDIPTARAHSRSFDKFYREVEKLLG